MHGWLSKMINNNILINYLPKQIAENLKQSDYQEILEWFIDDEINKTEYAQYISMLACIENNIELHLLAQSIYYLHFNWVENAYQLAYFHYWKALEIEKFSNEENLESFLLIVDDPNFYMVKGEDITFIKEKLKKLNPSNETLFVKFRNL